MERCKVERIREVFKVSNGNIKIEAVIERDGRISILNHKGDAEFKFINSTHEMVRLVAELLYEASEIHQRKADL